MITIRARRLYNALTGGHINAATFSTLAQAEGRAAEFAEIFDKFAMLAQIQSNSTHWNAVVDCPPLFAEICERPALLKPLLNDTTARNSILSTTSKRQAVANSASAIATIDSTGSNTVRDAFIDNSSFMSEVAGNDAGAAAFAGNSNLMDRLTANGTRWNEFFSWTRSVGLGLSTLRLLYSGSGDSTLAAQATLTAVLANATAAKALASSGGLSDRLNDSSTFEAALAASPTAAAAYCDTATNGTAGLIKFLEDSSFRALVGVGSGTPTAFYSAISNASNPEVLLNYMIHLAGTNWGPSGTWRTVAAVYAESFTNGVTGESFLAFLNNAANTGRVNAITAFINSNKVIGLARDTNDSAGAMAVYANAPAAAVTTNPFIALAWAVETSTANNYTLANVRSGSAITGVHTGMPAHGGTTISVSWANVKSAVLGNVASSIKAVPIQANPTGVQNSYTMRVLVVLGLKGS